MNIELSSQTAQRIQGLLDVGDYTSAKEVVDAGVMLLELRAKVQEGIDDIAAGRATTLESKEQLREYFEDIKRRGRERMAKQQAAE